MSKGSTRRPAAVDAAEVSRRWEETFASAKTASETSEVSEKASRIISNMESSS